MSEAVEVKRDEAQEVAQEEEALEVRTYIEAKWQIERRKKLISDRDELIAYYKQQIEDVKADAEFKLGFIDRALLAFFNSKPHQKTKTTEYIKLPNGKLVLKKQDPEFKRDEAKVIEWLKKNNGTAYIKVTESLDWANLKKDTSVLKDKIVTVDGEIVPGVEVVERDAKFAVEG